MIPQNAIHDAMMKAADHIESDPEHFQFMSTSVPSSINCGTPGCALGWTSAFLYEAGHLKSTKGHSMPLFDEIRIQAGINDDDFYGCMNQLQRAAGRRSWMYNAQSCAETLRDYANEHYPRSAPAPTYPSKNIMEVFTNDSRTSTT